MTTTNRPEKVFHTRNHGAYRVRMLGDGRWEWYTGETSYVFERLYVPGRSSRRKHFWSMPNGQGRDTLKAAVLATVRDHYVARGVCRAFATLNAEAA